MRLTMRKRNHTVAPDHLLNNGADAREGELRSVVSRAFQQSYPQIVWKRNAAETDLRIVNTPDLSKK